MTVQPPLGVSPRRRSRHSAPRSLLSGFIKITALSGAVAGWVMLALFASGALAPADRVHPAAPEIGETDALTAFAQPALRGRAGDVEARAAPDFPEPEPEFPPQAHDATDGGTQTARRGADRLAPAPLEGLYELTHEGAALPVIAPDGRTPLQAYARLSDAHTDQPRLGVILTGLGPDPALTADAILSTPPETTLSFVSDAPSLAEWIAAARAAGHETMLELAMEPHGYPMVDPGPYTLLTNASRGENRRRLLAQLGAAPGYCALRMRHGEKFADRPERAAAPFEDMAARGLGLVLDAALPHADDLSLAARQAGLPSAQANALGPLSALTAPAPGLYAVAASPETIAGLMAWTQLAREQGLSPAPACSFISSEAGAAG